MKDPPSHDLRQELHALAERLPESATWAEVEEYVRFRAAVADGKAASRRGDFASDDDVQAAFTRWGIDVAD